MISSSNPAVERGLDAMLIVYSLLDNHPASAVCEQFIRAHTGWCTSAVTLLEARAILSKVYAVDPTLASQKLAQFASGPILVAAVDAGTVLTAMSLADRLGIDLTDATLLQVVQAQGVTRLATDDKKLAQACRKLGIAPETPIDTSLRQQMAAWEAAHLPAKGLPRVLRRIYQWLLPAYPQVAQEFWSQTGGCSHLP